MTIGEEIRGIRKRKGLTLVQLAKKVGVTQAYLSLVEKDQRTVSHSVAIELAKHLDVSFERIEKIVGARSKSDLLDENKRLREALELILEDEAPNCDGYETFIHATARKALGGE